MKLTGLVAQCVSNASFHILKKKTVQGMGNSGIHTNKP